MAQLLLHAVDRRLPRRRHRRARAERRPSWRAGSIRSAPRIAALQDDYRTRRLPHLRIAEETADLAAAEAALARLSQGADTIVFFGTGGSSLGGQTLAQLGGWNIPGMADARRSAAARARASTTTSTP